MKKNTPTSEHWKPKGKWKSPIRWTSETKHVDIDTGELITKNTAKNEFTKITTDHAHTISEHTPTGHVEHTILYRRKQQLHLF